MDLKVYFRITINLVLFVAFPSLRHNFWLFPLFGKTFGSFFLLISFLSMYFAYHFQSIPFDSISSLFSVPFSILSISFPFYVFPLALKSDLRDRRQPPFVLMHAGRQTFSAPSVGTGTEYQVATLVICPLRIVSPLFSGLWAWCS